MPESLSEKLAHPINGLLRSYQRIQNLLPVLKRHNSLSKSYRLENRLIDHDRSYVHLRHSNCLYFTMDLNFNNFLRNAISRNSRLPLHLPDITEEHKLPEILHQGRQPSRVSNLSHKNRQDVKRSIA